MPNFDRILLNEEGDEVTQADVKREFCQKVYFGAACAPSPFHWHFQQAYEALLVDLYLPGVSGLLNGIEASLRTTITALEGSDVDGDLGAVLCNKLLQSAEQKGLNIELLAFSDESDFRQKLQTKDEVKLVRLRNDICHGNFGKFKRNVDDIDFFTPDCVGEVSAQLLQISFNWTRFLCDFFRDLGWRATGSEELIVPHNPLSRWLT